MFESFRDRKANQPSEQSSVPGERRRPTQNPSAQGVAPEMKDPNKSETARRSAVLPSHSANPVARQLEMVTRRTAHFTGTTKDDAEVVASKEGQKLVVGPRIRLKGEVTNCDVLIIEGHFEGTAKSRMLQVAQGGSFQGEAEVERAEMSGKFEGGLTVSNRLIIRTSGRVSGTVQYFGVEIEQGGQLSGNIQVIADETSLSPSKPEAKNEEDDGPVPSQIAS